MERSSDCEGQGTGTIRSTFDGADRRMTDARLPQRLYHYTTLANLSLILRERKIRCRRLDRVDDLTEGHPADCPSLAKYIFVSCWSEDSEESIPLWHMYSAGMRGVRISLPSDFVMEHEYHSEPAKGFYVEAETRFVIPQEDIHGLDYFFWLMPGQYPLYRIDYTDDAAKLFPSIVDQTKEGVVLAMGDVGIFKRLEWQFQQEWRFKVMALPAAAPSGSYADPNYQRQMNPLPRIMNRQLISIDHCDLDIKPSAFLDMRITLGPRFHPGDRYLLESYLDRDDLHAVRLEESTLSGTIR